jgi:hypothetical protein
LHWRFAAMAGNFLETLLREEIPVTLPVASLFSKCLHNELPAMRKGSISAVIRILYLIKKQSQGQGLWKPGYKRIVKPADQGLRHDNFKHFQHEKVATWNCDPSTLSEM